MTKRIILSRTSKQTSTPWFKTKKGLEIKLTNRTMETITCDEDDYNTLSKNKRRELKELGLTKR